MVAAGVPLSLLAGAIMPSFGVTGFAWLALVLLLMLADAIFCTGTVPHLRVQAPCTLQVGHKETLTVWSDFAGTVPASIELAVGTSDRIDVQPVRLMSRPGQAGNFVLSPQRRGEASIDQVWARWRGPLGMIWRQHSKLINERTPVLINTKAAQDFAARRFSQSIDPGVMMCRQAGDGGELNALKEFTAGSDRRMIDWKQSARHGALLTREYRAERSTTLLLAIDTGRLMSEPIAGTPRVDHSVTTALAVASAALMEGDRVALLSFNSAPQLVSGLTNGMHAFGDLQRLATMIDCSNEETDFAAGVTTMLDTLDRRAIVIIFTDFAAGDAADRMVGSLARLLVKHAGLFVVFRDEDVEQIADTEPRTGRSIARSIVAGAMRRERQAAFDQLTRLGARLAEIRPKDATAALLSRYMRMKRDPT